MNVYLKKSDLRVYLFGATVFFSRHWMQNNCVSTCLNLVTQIHLQYLSAINWQHWFILRFSDKWQPPDWFADALPHVRWADRHIGIKHIKYAHGLYLCSYIIFETPFLLPYYCMVAFFLRSPRTFLKPSGTQSCARPAKSHQLSAIVMHNAIIDKFM